MKTANQSPKNSKTDNINRPSFRVNARDLFDTFDHHANWKRVYCAYFHAVPSSKCVYGIDCAKLAKWIEPSLGKRILKKIANERYGKRKRRMTSESIIYILSGGFLILLDAERDYVEILFSEGQEEAQEFVSSIKKFIRRLTISKISLVVLDREGFSLKDLKNKKPALQLDKNYNDDLVPLHESLVKTLKTENSSGLVLFHGVPGTGKSTYIRFISTFVKKKIIFLSPRMAGNLDDPNFAKLLIENPNSVIIIEDAEDLLISRDTDKNSGISMLLNLTDGLLGTTLGIQFICTFNTPVTNIDKALLRKGRLIALYEFGPLSLDKARLLLTELGTDDFKVTQPMTLADIYNVSQPEFRLEAKRNPIGFSSRVA